MAVTVTTRIEEDLLKAIDKAAAAEATDRSTVIRKLLIESIKKWEIKQTLHEYEEGKLTFWQAARKCGISVWEMMDEAKKYKPRVPYTMEDFEHDIKGLKS